MEIVEKVSDIRSTMKGDMHLQNQNINARLILLKNINTGIAVHVSALKWFKNEQKSLQA